jgi:hypothetical protein
VRCLSALGAFCLLACSFRASGGDTYGLLFTSPAQRAQLDNRFNNRAAADTGAAAPVGEPLPAQSLKLNGTLTSSAGKKEVWINGRRQLSVAGGPAAAVSITGPDTVQVKSAPSAKAQAMKPGQVMDAATGEISEAYLKAAGKQGL